MTKRILVVFFVSLFFLPGIFADDQEGEDGILYEKVLKYLSNPVITNSLEDDANYCKVLMIGATNFEPTFAEWAILDFATEYLDGDDWNMCLVAVNSSNQPVPVFVEFELRWWNGGRKIYRRWSRTLPAATVMLYMAPITTQIKQLGLFTIIGRISGNYVGNNNVVQTQIYIY